jgi:NAD(P)-dependent dehydrogenase (short-subunit alcohol dehydrogenase family)
LLEFSAKPGSLLGLRILITGAGRGLGAALAENFSRQGARLALCALSDPTETAQACTNSGAEVLHQSVDVCDADAVAAWVGFVVGQWGGLDVVVNNAGILGPVGVMESVSLEQWQKTIQVNVLGAYHVARASLEALKTNRGVLVNIGSGASRKAHAGLSAYCVSKAALEALHRSLCIDNPDGSVRFLCLNPGAMRTRMRVQFDPAEDPETVTSPAVVANALACLVAESKTSQENAELWFDSAAGIFLPCTL